MSNLPIAAAQYLRMSTERQEYSLENQSETIAKYAANHGFQVIQTYSDPAKTGVLLRRRKGLQKLIEDVVKHQATFRAILVYDVSRWGRFLDTDESAYYEFLCKLAGVRLHYCAETFQNDDALPSMVMKSLKRAMAGEFSREMGVKVAAGQTRGATLGFRQGAIPGYGLRRYLVGPDRTPRQQLEYGERKGLATDRVILVLGPDHEIRVVRQIYSMFVKEQMTLAEIARQLNRRRVKFIDGREWRPDVVKRILTHPKYIGSNVYGQKTRRLYTPEKRKPRAEWVVTQGAFKPLVDSKIYAKAQEDFERRKCNLPRNRSDRSILDDLRKILDENGRISVDLIDKTPTAPSTITYRKRFGTLSHAYELVGYKKFCGADWLETRRRIQTLRANLMRNIVDSNSPKVSIEKGIGRHSQNYLVVNGQIISVSTCRPIHCYKGAIRWLLNIIKKDCFQPVLVARLNLECNAFRDLFLIRPVGRRRALYLMDADPRLESGVRLTKLEEFCGAVERLGSLQA